MGSRWSANARVRTELFKTHAHIYKHLKTQIEVYKHRRVKTNAVYAELFMTVKTYKQLTNHNTTIQQHSTTPGDAEQHTGTVKTEILREYECVFKRKMESAVRVRSAFAAFMQHCKTRLSFTILITFFSHLS